MKTQENTSVSEPAKEQSVSRLPVLTKVAAWWILVVGIVGVIGAIVFPIVLSTMGYSDEQEWGQVVGIVAMIFWMGVCPVFILVTVAGGVLFTRSRWALIFSIVIISIVVFGSTIGGVFSFIGLLFIPVALLIVPLIMLMADAGNYWNMARAVQTAQTVQTRYRGFAIASLACGAFSIFLFAFILAVGIIPGLLGLVFGIVALRHARGVISKGTVGVAIGGIALSSIGLIGAVYALVLLI